MSKRNPNEFRFRQFGIRQTRSAMKIGIDGVLLGAWVKVPHSGKILDVGCGTGLLSLMLAQRCPTRIDAIDISRDAYEESIYNISQSPWKERIQAFHASFIDFAAQCTSSCDLIISNPPFFKNGIKPIEPNRDLARHEHSLPLKVLFEGAVKCLSEHGRLAFIYPYDRLEEIMALCQKHDLQPARLCHVRPKPGKDFHRVLIEAGKQQVETEVSELTIETESHLDYTDEFRELTGDFYL